MASAARRLAKSASSIVTREVRGSHKLTIDGYKLSRMIPRTWYETSQTFEAGGYSWRIIYYPRGDRLSLQDDDGISLFLQLQLAKDPQLTTDPVNFKFTMLDQAGNPIPRYSRSKELCTFSEDSRSSGFHDFIKHTDLEKSGCLKDDCFTVQCDITAIRDWPTEIVHVDDDNDSTTMITVPPSDLHKHLTNLLWNKQGTDLTFDVGGETFEAHRWLLAERSPVFQAAIASISMKKDKLKIDGVEPRAFKAMLHFMYTDLLPADVVIDTDVAMARDLLAAAHRFELERLRLMCEEALCKRIEVGTVADTLVAAEKHHCHALKAACVEFIGRPGNLKAISETKSFDKISPALMMKLAVKQLA